MKKFLEKSAAFVKYHPKIDVAFLLVALATFVTITLFNATNASIWFDEAFSAYIVRFNFIEIAQFTATDVHPPMYYWALKVWTELFGTGELALRSMSIFFGVGVIITAYFLARKLFGRKVATLSLIFLTLSPMLIRYSDEARMYTMAAFIVFAATLVLVKATESKQRRWWVLYGVLVSLGMWTHYFTALAWLAHWVWRAWETRKKGNTFKQWWKRFFGKGWVLGYGVAVILYLPWLYFMVKQLGVVQSSGFWIGPVGVDTPTNYLSNIFYYLEHNQVTSWLAVALLAIITIFIVLVPKVYKTLNRSEKSSFMLVASLAFAPPILLFIASLPPLRSSFVERYLIPAIVAFMLLLAITFVIGTKKWKPVLRALPILVIAGMMIFGITNVYKYGNYNKNTNTHIVTREVINEIHNEATPGEPIVANSPWLFYEAIPYATEDHPIYFIDANTQYIYGSLDMLKERDNFKIINLDEFAKENPIIWYLGQADSGDIAPYKDSWVKLQTITYLDPLTNKDNYRATQYRISGE